MFFKNDDKVLKFDNLFLAGKSGLTMTVNTPVFPLHIGGGTQPNIRFQFNIPITVIVDYGDSIAAYPAVEDTAIGKWRFGIADTSSGAGQPELGDIGPHTYTDGVTEHIVNIYYPPDILYDFAMTQVTLPAQDFIFGFSQHTELVSFAVNALYTDATRIDYSLLKLDLLNIQFSGIRRLAISNCFHSTSPFNGAIPEPLLTLPLEYLAFGDTGFNGKQLPFAHSNMDDIGNLACKDTLQQMRVTWDILDQNGLAHDTPDNGAIPESWKNLKKLYQLWFISPGYTVVPAMLNDLPVLRDVSITANDTLTGWGNVTLDMTDINFTTSSSLSTTAPAWLGQMTSLKRLLLQSTFQDTARIDAFITSLYNVITGAAAPPLNVALHLEKNVNFPSGIPSPAQQGMLTSLENDYGWRCTYET